MDNSTNKEFFMLTMVPEKQIPKDGWDVTVRSMDVIAKGTDMRDAINSALAVMEDRELYMKCTHAYSISNNDLEFCIRGDEDNGGA